MDINTRVFKAIIKGSNRNLTGIQTNFSWKDKLMNLKEAIKWVTVIQKKYLKMGKTGRINVSLNTLQGRTSQKLIPLGQNDPYVIDPHYFYDLEKAKSIMYDVFLDKDGRGIREVSVFIVLDD